VKLGGRLTGHFLLRVALLVAGLGLLFLAWAGVLTLTVLEANRNVDSVQPATALAVASDTATLTANGVVLSTKSVADAKAGGYWIQVLDEQGNEVTQTGRPAAIPRHYTPGALVYARQAPGSVHQRRVATWFSKVNGRELTYVLGIPGRPAQGPTIFFGSQLDSPSTRTVLELFAALLVGGALVTLGIAWLFGRTLAKPLVHMMSWLSALARGEFAEPLDRKGRPVSRTADGLRLRRPYSTYREVFESLDTLTAELRSTAEDRARLEAARDEWIAGVSHDLRTPLTSIQGYANVLSSDYEFDPAETRRQAEVIAKQAGHMDELLDDLNLSFRLRADGLMLAREPVDLVELVRESAVALANDPRAAGRDIVFDEPPGSGPITARVDAAMLRRAVANLLVNAAVHNPEGTTVRASVSRGGDHATIIVADDGVGMNDETRRRLFDRYYRGTPTGTGPEGTGLGMAIARDIVQAHGGVIEVASSPGKGSSAVMVLPLAAS
jgi:signal transduction histidine kinase